MKTTQKQLCVVFVCPAIRGTSWIII